MQQSGRLPVRSSRRAAICAAAGVCLLSTVATAANGHVATLDERIQGSESVVVATVRSVTPEWRENEFGDRVIVSRLELAVDETLKGGATRTVWMELEGGTLDGLTLHVSSLPLVEQPGVRAVFFLDPASRGVYRPHLRGQGILFLDEENAVRGTSLRVDDIRTRARALAAGR